MNSTINKRLAALETAAMSTDYNLRLVIAEPGETADQARLRKGIEPDTDKVLVVVFV